MSQLLVQSLMVSPPQTISIFGGMDSSFHIVGAVPFMSSKNQYNSRTLFKQRLSRNRVYSPRKRGIINLAKGINGGATTFSIKKSDPVLVPPATATYNGLYYLSGIDQNLMCPLEIVYSYKGNGRESTDNACKVIKKALSEVLVHFYPLAGRLTMTQDGNFMVNCTGEGVYFVEAVIEQDLDEFGDITIPNSAKLRPLLHLYDGKNLLDMPLLTVQVTLFKCGGFIIGIALNHCMMDGTSVTEFINSWAEIARGLPLSVPPFLDRSILKPTKISKTKFPRNLISKIDGLFSEMDIVDRTTIKPYKQKVYTSVHFGPEKLMQLKKTVIEEGIERIPTNYELLTAFMSREIIRSLMVEPPRRKKLLFPVNVRAKLCSWIPKGYFGNCFWVGYMGCNNEDKFIGSSLSVIVNQVQEALKLVTVESIQTLMAYAEATGLHVSPVSAYTFSNLTRMSVYRTDFGWGDSQELGLASLTEYDIYFSPQRKIDRNNVTVIFGLSPAAMEIFQRSIEEAFENSVDLINQKETLSLVK